MNPVGVLLSVIAGLVALVVVVAIYNGITSKLKEGESIRLLNMLRANVESTYASQSSYGANNDDIVPVMAGFGRIPDGARKGTGGTATIEHPFGAAVSIRGNGGRFQITFEELDDETCKALGEAYVGRTRSGSGIVAMLVAAAAPATVSAVAPVSRDLAWLNDNCDEGAASNHLSFVFG